MSYLTYWTPSQFKVIDHIPVAYMFGVLLYMTVVIPGLRTVCTPIEGETRAVQVEALRVLAAGNTLIAACLGLVLALQVCERTFLVRCLASL